MSSSSIGSIMKMKPFSRPTAGEASPPPDEVQDARDPVERPRTGATFPADEVVWGVAIRDGFDELDDPFYHRGVTQHAYLEGNDSVAICGFRPPRSGPRTRRRARLGLPTPGENPMCGSCAKMVVAPRPRTPMPTLGRTTVATPVNGANGVRPRVGLPVRPVRPPVAVPVSGSPSVPVGMPGSQPIERTAPAPRRDGHHISPRLERAGHAAEFANVMETPSEARRRNDGLRQRGVQGGEPD